MLHTIASLRLQAREKRKLQIHHRRRARDTTPDTGDTQMALATTAQKRRRTNRHGMLSNYQDTGEGVAATGLGFPVTLNTPGKSCQASYLAKTSSVRASTDPGECVRASTYHTRTQYLLSAGTPPMIAVFVYNKSALLLVTWVGYCICRDSFSDNHRCCCVQQ